MKLFNVVSLLTLCGASSAIAAAPTFAECAMNGAMNSGLWYGVEKFAELPMSHWMARTEAQRLTDIASFGISYYARPNNLVIPVACVLAGRMFLAAADEVGKRLRGVESKIEAEKLMLKGLVESLESGMECDSLSSCLATAAKWRKLGFVGEAARLVERGASFARANTEPIWESAKGGNFAGTVQNLLHLQTATGLSLKVEIREVAWYAGVVAKRNPELVEMEALWADLLKCFDSDTPRDCLEAFLQ